MHNNEIAIESVRESVSAIDKVIGGMGIDNLLVRLENNHGFTGRYPDEERPIHRPLQYALWSIYLGQSRTAIEENCQHLEGILKLMFEGAIENVDIRPLGSIAKEIKKRSLLNGKIIDQLILVSKILGIAKHEYNENAIRIPNLEKSLKSQVFNIHEAISMYFICRKIGMHLIQSPEASEMASNASRLHKMGQ
jgi:hypothetical protein